MVNVLYTDDRLRLNPEIKINSVPFKRIRCKQPLPSFIRHWSRTKWHVFIDTGYNRLQPVLVFIGSCISVLLLCNSFCPDEINRKKDKYHWYQISHYDDYMTAITSIMETKYAFNLDNHEENICQAIYMPDV